MDEKTIAVVVVLEGGLVQSVYTNRAVGDLRVLIRDYDTEGTDPDDAIGLHADEGGDFWLTAQDVLVDPEFVAKMVDLYDEGQG